MRVKNVSGRARELDDVDGRPLVAEVDEEIEVSDALGASLLEQPRNWAPVEEPDPPAKKAKRGDAPSDEEQG